MRNIWEALSDSTRREILELLKQKDMNAGDIYNYFDITKPSLSHHLSVLKQSNLVYGEKRGQSIIYSLNSNALDEAVEYIDGLKK